MRSINKLEDWNTKADSYNPRAGNGWLWAIIVALILFAFTAPVFAVAPCVVVDEGGVTDGLSTNGIFHFNFFAPEYDIVIEVKTGGYFGEGRDFCINLPAAKTQGMYLQLQNRTAPIYVVCYKADNTTSSGDNGCWGKMETYSIFSLFSDLIKSGEDLEYAVQNPINTIQNNESDIFETKIIESEEQRVTNDYRSPLAIGLLILIIAAAVFIYSKNPIIGATLFFVISIGLFIMIPSMYWIGLIGVVISIIIAIATIANMNSRR